MLIDGKFQIDNFRFENGFVLIVITLAIKTMQKYKIKGDDRGTEHKQERFKHFFSFIRQNESNLLS